MGTSGGEAKVQKQQTDKNGGRGSYTRVYLFCPPVAQRNRHGEAVFVCSHMQCCETGLDFWAVGVGSEGSI